MTKKKVVFSLGLKLLLSILIALILSAGLYLASSSIGDGIIANSYMSDEAIASRSTANMTNFSSYVSTDAVGTADIRKLTKWLKANKGIYLCIIDPASGAIIYESGWEMDDVLTVTDDAGSASDQVVMDGNGTIEWTQAFTDGTYRVSLTDYTETRRYGLVTFISLLIAVVAFFAINTLYIIRITHRIKTLSDEVFSIENGQNERPITDKGNDEIGMLADTVDNMRHALINKSRKEKEAWSANNELITAMSHDIRTPLTSLIGYLDILKNKDTTDEGTRDEYIAHCADKAAQLRTLSDKLFEYFLVFGSETVTTRLETFAAAEVFPQILGEHQEELELNGFSVESSLAPLSGSVTVDVNYLSRLFNNLFANIVKHGSTTRPVTITLTTENGMIMITLENGIKPEALKTDSNSIGLKTCKKICESLKGTLTTGIASGVFTVTVSLPFSAKEESSHE